MDLPCAPGGRFRAGASSRFRIRNGAARSILQRQAFAAGDRDAVAYHLHAIKRGTPMRVTHSQDTRRHSGFQRAAVSGNDDPRGRRGRRCRSGVPRCH